MLEILTIVVFCWLSFKLLGLFFRMAWGAAKLIASILFVIALPLLVLCLIFAGGMLLLIESLNGVSISGIAEQRIVRRRRGQHNIHLVRGAPATPPALLIGEVEDVARRSEALLKVAAVAVDYYPRSHNSSPSFALLISNSTIPIPSFMAWSMRSVLRSMLLTADRASTHPVTPPMMRNVSPNFWAN